MMGGWLSATWEPNWRSFQYFNSYRFLVAVFLLVCALYPITWLSALSPFERKLFEGAAIAYCLFAGAGLVLSWRWRRRFNFQLTLQVAGDALGLSVVMFALGGVSSGVGLVLLISMASASLVGRGRLVLFYAALATVGILTAQFFLVLGREQDLASLVQAGLLSAGFFATAVLARLLGQRIMANEELARQRGIALANEMHIGERILERMQDGVLVLSAQGVVRRFNPGAEMLLGVTQPEGMLLSDCVPALPQAFTASPLELFQERELEARSGRRLRFRFVPTDSSSGEVVLFLEDVTRIREQAQHLKLASLGRLTASIAHEIRNPLAAISHAAELLNEERRGEVYDRLLRIVQDNVFRLDRIVQDVLKLGRGDRGMMEVIDLPSFLEGFLAEFSVVEKVDASVLMFESEATTLCFDRSQLLQVVWNLVGNGLRHCQRLPGSVRVRSNMLADGRVELHVIDDGPGIPQDLHDQIFEPFFTTRHQGLGLGLFVARELCEANGAQLQLLPGAAGGHFVIVGGAQCLLPEANDVHVAI